MTTGLNHITLAVSDLDRSVRFYGDLLGFCVRMNGPSSAYLEAGNLWLALVEDAAARSNPLPEYTHFAFTVDEAGFSTATERLRRAGVICWQASERADSFYFLDPDGHKLELHSGDLARRLREPATRKAGEQTRCTGRAAAPSHGASEFKH
jgi:catechol 2,3-dioxygenase-like lactoylglutathione lyase family enzyme